MADVLNVKKRVPKGKKDVRRLRASGFVPVILYGHKEAALSFSVPRLEITAALRHGSRVVQLKGDTSERALVKEVQWDVYGVDVLHVDLARVSDMDRVKVTISVELKGEAPGVKAGGVINHLVHELHIECLASAIPDKLQLKLDGLVLDGSLEAKDVVLPPGVKLLDDPELSIVQCHLPRAEEAVAAPEAGAVEPEIIGKKEKEEGEEEAEA